MLYIGCQGFLSLFCLVFLYAYNMDSKTIIARWIKDARTKAELSGAELGAKLALEMRIEKGITRANVSHWETEKHSPNLQQVLGIVKITGVGLPASIIQAMQGGADRMRSVGSPQPGSSLERLDADEWTMLQMYRSSTVTSKDLIRKTANSAEKEANLSNSTRRSDNR